jgi:hypothetical protein
MVRPTHWLRPLSVTWLALLARCAVPESNTRADARVVDARADAVVIPPGMDAQTPCSGGDTRCNGVCTSVQSDPANCGTCGTVCPPTQSCQAGRCANAMPTCPGTQTSCGGMCVDTRTDSAHCGACGRTCAMGQTCMDGMCAGTAMCPAGQTRCGASCVVLDVDPMNCGACGMACPAGQRCAMGTCMSARPACPMGETDCAPMAPAPSCVDLRSSAANCGSCANACATGQTCAMGACACAPGTTLCGRTCANTMTDTANCGACGRACPAGQVCAAGTCGCPTGQSLCGGVCTMTQTDRNNCGACGMACPMGQVCAAGRCACPTGQALCGTPAMCVDTQSDRANCGACGMACPMGQVCTAGRCACPTGQALCGTPAMCVDTQSSSLHCGRCDAPCAAGTGCMAGVCRGLPPANDTRATAATLDLAMPSQTITINTSAARNDTTGSCGCTSGNDVFYRFVLSSPEVVYADTLGTSFDTSLFLQNSAGTNVTAAAGSVTCNDDVSSAALCSGLSGLQSMIAARLDAGTYFLVLSGCGSGAATLRFQHVPAGAGTATRVTPTTTAQTATGTTGATSAYSGTCCSSGGDASFWWLTCPSTAAAPFYASTCNPMTGVNRAGYNSSLSQHSALRAGPAVCNDDVGFVCANGSTVTSTIPATTANQVGLNSVVVDGCMAMGTFSVDYSLGACASGARCGGACVDTQTDANHCGGCDRRCPAGQSCRAGMCDSAPTNDLPSAPVIIDMANPQSLFTVNTASARGDATGPCTCTSGNDVFYQFTIPAGQSEIVYADTIGSSFDTSLFLQTTMGANVIMPNLGAEGLACNDNGGLSGCATGMQSQILARLEAGTYRLVLSGCGSGMANLRFQHVPAGNGSVTFLPAGASVTASTSTSGTGRVSSSCGSSGPENTYFWYTCAGATGGAFTATTCSRATWDTSLSQNSPGAPLPWSATTTRAERSRSWPRRSPRAPASTRSTSTGSPRRPRGPTRSP